MKTYKKTKHPNRHIMRESQEGDIVKINGKEYPRGHVNKMQKIIVKIGETVETTVPESQMIHMGFELLGNEKKNKEVKEVKHGNL